MDLDEPDLTSPRPQESSELFEARLRMLRQVGPIAKRLAEAGFNIVVESERRSSHAAQMESDLVIEFGDARIRAMIFPGSEEPWAQLAIRDRLPLYFLHVADTDAVALVADDEGLSTAVLDVYDANQLGMARPLTRPFFDAIATYFSENVLAVEPPDFKAALTLPTEDELRERMERALQASFEGTRKARARIPEKVAALEALDVKDLRRLVRQISGVLEGQGTTPDDLLGRVEGGST